MDRSVTGCDHAVQDDQRQRETERGPAHNQHRRAYEQHRAAERDRCQGAPRLLEAGCDHRGAGGAGEHPDAEQTDRRRSAHVEGVHAERSDESPLRRVGQPERDQQIPESFVAPLLREVRVKTRESTKPTRGCSPVRGGRAGRDVPETEQDGKPIGAASTGKVDAPMCDVIAAPCGRARAWRS